MVPEVQEEKEVKKTAKEELLELHELMKKHGILNIGQLEVKLSRL